MPRDRTGEEWDPLDEANRPSRPETDCMNGRCDGSGWVQVQPGYANQAFPYPDHPGLGVTQAQLDEYAALVARLDVLRAGAVHSVYPCKDCQPSLFYRWAAGCLEADHRRADCERCQEAGAASQRRRARAR